MGAQKSIGSREVQAAVDRLSAAIRTRYASDSAPWLVGIANGGVILAQRLANSLRASGLAGAQSGTVDISFHRDDIGRHPIPKEFTPTLLPGDVAGASIILVDDVLFTGRTVKAALDELFDHGRPGRVELAVLVDRGGRRLPVAADYVGLTVETREEETVTVALGPKENRRDSIRIGS